MCLACQKISKTDHEFSMEEIEGQSNNNWQGYRARGGKKNSICL